MKTTPTPTPTTAPRIRPEHFLGITGDHVGRRHVAEALRMHRAGRFPGVFRRLPDGWAINGRLVFRAVGPTLDRATVAEGIRTELDSLRVRIAECERLDARCLDRYREAWEALREAPHAGPADLRRVAARMDSLDRDRTALAHKASALGWAKGNLESMAAALGLL